MGSVFIDVAQTSSEVVEAHQKKEEGAGAREAGTFIYHSDVDRASSVHQVLN